MKKAVLFVLLLCSTGCATLIVRPNKEKANVSGLYPAIKADVKAFRHARKANTIAGDWTYGFSQWVIIPLVVLDVPFSLVFDTLLIPFDLFDVDQTGRDQP